MLAGLCCLLTVSLSFAADDDEDDDDDDQGKRCINVRTLKRTEVVDDQHILFYMSGKTVYINTLPKTCKGLSRERRFSYSTSGRSLCSFDTIRILSDAGSGLYEGRACRLGDFHLTSIEDIEAARERGEELPEAIPPSGADEEELGTETDRPQE